MSNDSKFVKCFNCGQTRRLGCYERHADIICTGCGKEMKPMIFDKVREIDKRKILIKKLTIISLLVLAAAVVFGVTVKALEVSDPCGDAGGGGSDIKKITATSDGTDIMLTVEFCANAVDYTKYFIRIDYKDPDDLDNDLVTNEPDTLIDNNRSCLTTFDAWNTRSDQQRDRAWHHRLSW